MFVSMGRSFTETHCLWALLWAATEPVSKYAMYLQMVICAIGHTPMLDIYIVHHSTRSHNFAGVPNTDSSIFAVFDHPFQLTV